MSVDSAAGLYEGLSEQEKAIAEDIKRENQFVIASTNLGLPRGEIGANFEFAVARTVSQPVIDYLTEHYGMERVGRKIEVTTRDNQDLAERMKFPTMIKLECIATR